jgi:hypothetical protein
LGTKLGESVVVVEDVVAEDINFGGQGMELSIVSFKI